MNKWVTPFEAWCAITRTYEKPFEDTIYTAAGKTIEPKQAEYMKQSYGMDIITPADRFGTDYFKTTRGDFFPESKLTGGMWDYLGVDEDGNVDTVLEMKTTKRSEDWADDIPEYYALQAALYAHLLGVDNVIMVCSFLQEADYAHPDKFIPSVQNTITAQFRVSERYPDFAQKVKYVEQWWDAHVETGISPEYDEKKDAEILAALRTNTLAPDTNIGSVITEAEALKKELDEVKASLADKEKRLKTLNNIIKEYATKQFRAGDKKVAIDGAEFIWTVSYTQTTDIDKDALKSDGLFEKYSKTTDSYKLTVKERGEKE